MPTGEDAHGSDYFTPVFLLPQLCNSTHTIMVTRHQNHRERLLALQLTQPPQRFTVTTCRSIPQTHQCRLIRNLPKVFQNHLIMLLS